MVGTNLTTNNLDTQKEQSEDKRRLLYEAAGMSSSHKELGRGKESPPQNLQRERACPTEKPLTLDF
jgi:hypothetical protein